MYAKLYNLWFVDQRARWCLYVGSIVAAFGYGVINSLVLGRPESRITWETLGLLCAMVLGLTMVYCARKERRASEEDSDAIFKGNRFTLAFAAATALMLLLTIRPGRRLDASRTSYKLISIRVAVQEAQTLGVVLPSSQLAKYKSTLRQTSPSSAEFFSSVAAVINYQSWLNQKDGLAPDPAKVSRPCMLTNEGSIRSYGNAIIGMPVSNCVVDLDTQLFSDVTFKDAVVRYHGGPVQLSNVTFVNCRFILNLPPSAIPAQNLVFALLNSPNQEIVKISG